MTKQIFEIIAKSYVRNYVHNKFTADELIGLLHICEQCLGESVMFRFGKDNTILYTINDIERDLMHSTQNNRNLLNESMRESIKYNSCFLV